MPLSTHILAGALIPDLLKIAALIVLILIVLLLIIILVPILLRLDLQKKGQLIEGKLRASWLFISARGDLLSNESGIKGEFLITLLGIKVAKKEISAQSPGDLSLGDKESGAKGKDDGQYQRVERKRPEAKRKKKSHSRMPRPRSILAAVPHLFHFVRDALKSVDLKTLCCRLGIGRDDPSETAILSGRLWSVASALRYKGADIQIEPSFDEEKLDGELLADIRIRLLYILSAIVFALRQKEIRSLVKEVLGWGQ